MQRMTACPYLTPMGFPVSKSHGMMHMQQMIGYELQ
jgi:hypothetical protein